MVGPKKGINKIYAKVKRIILSFSSVVSFLFFFSCWLTFLPPVESQPPLRGQVSHTMPHTPLPTRPSPPTIVRSVCSGQISLQQLTEKSLFLAVIKTFSQVVGLLRFRHFHFGIFVGRRPSLSLASKWLRHIAGASNAQHKVPLVTIALLLREEMV